MLNNSYATAKPTITVANNNFSIAGASGTIVYYTVDGSDPATSDSAVNAAANTATVPVANIIAGDGLIRAVAVPNNTSKFRSDVATNSAS